MKMRVFNKVIFDGSFLKAQTVIVLNDYWFSNSTVMGAYNYSQFFSIFLLTSLKLFLCSFRFTCVINCVAGLKQVAPSHITVLNIPIEDEEQTDLSPYWKTVFQTIEEQRKSGGKVLIFCGMGISR